MKFIYLVAFLFSIQFSSSALAQAYRMETDSSEVKMNYDWLFAEVDAKRDPVLSQMLKEHVAAQGCMSSGGQLIQLHSENLGLSFASYYTAILRANQKMVLKFKMCDDAVQGSYQYLQLHLMTRDLSIWGEKSNFSKTTDAEVSLVAPDGSLVTPHMGPVYNNQNYKKAYRNYMESSLMAGEYTLTIQAGREPIGIGDLRLNLGSGN